MTSSTGADLISVDDTSKEILSTAEIVGRKMYSIRNSSTGAQVITIFPANNQKAVSLKGIILSPGQAYQEANGEGFECWQGAIQAISSVAGGQVSVFER